ncbi:uncharacterized protein MELLADRAFT_76113 [Melampsora larici-populina 98AG31]|uniref:Uncharacterized protein n=1 Tax=Melampsora larici-populina (strain 98AG31 / pathotype 3-4-7) TaxID=747676 RepID=F4SAX5_MELLP|nr:uncharacterized protein MELLADRAFT_76113 [Melampsora larici-populina 98AG31]EGF98182.1 hypothetical protein MELLADRAFT_76113 [Melampsora larici-populina 98AG31]
MFIMMKQRIRVYGHKYSIIFLDQMKSMPDQELPDRRSDDHQDYYQRHTTHPYEFHDDDAQDYNSLSRRIDLHDYELGTLR